MTKARHTPGSPSDLSALVALSQREYRAGRLAEAADACRKILAIRPGIAEMHNNLAIILAQDGKPDQAVAELEKAIGLKPDYAEAYNNLGNVLLSQDKFELAATRYEQALARQPGYASAHYNLGNVLLKQEKLELAAGRFEQAIALKPDYADAYNNLGNTLLNQGRLELAAARFEQAIVLRPDYADALNSLGNVLMVQDKFEEAAARFQQALTLRPDYAEAHVGLATCYLTQDDYERGWPAYEGRLRLHGLEMPTGLPRWQGEPLERRRVLLFAEQGLGDTFHFLRYARLLKERGAYVVLAAPQALRQLLASHPDLDELFILGSAAELPRADYFLPLHSAAVAFRTDAATIPGKTPYLWADSQLIDKWREKLAEIDGFKVGIVWQGARDFSTDRWRSMPLAHFAPLARLPGVRLVSLQKGFGSEQIAGVDFPVLDLSSRLDERAGPFMDTAAVIAGLDLIVAPNSAIAHLAGALGAPVWIALSCLPDWRWLRDRDDSPWYPTARLFRQSEFGQWQDVFERIANAVRAQCAETA